MSNLVLSENNKALVKNNNAVTRPITLWTPSQLTTSVWLDASDTSTITDIGGLVSNWADKSGNGYDVVQGNGSDQPITGTKTINGLNVLDFSSDWMANTSMPDYTGNVTTLFSVARRQTQVNNPSTITLYKQGSGNDYQSLLNLIAAYEGAGGGGSGGLKLQSQRNNTSLSQVVHPGNGVPYMFFTQFDGTQNTVYLNGTASSSVNQTGAFGYDSIYINCRFYSSPTELGLNDMAEIILINNTISVSDRQKIEGYLAWKWGLEGNLPIGHPYKSTPPRI